MERNVNWSVEFDIVIDGIDAHWDDLTDEEKENILQQIKEDYYSGIFLRTERKSMNRIKEALEELGVFYCIDKREEEKYYYTLVEFWTDTAGQDIQIEFDFDGTPEDFVKQFIECANNYNVDEEVEIYVDMRGKNGVPNTVRELLEDCEEAKETLMKIADRLQEAIS